jgi:hypothetical protein
MKKALKILIPVVCLLIVAAVVLVIGLAATPGKVEGAWVSTEPVFLFGKNRSAMLTLEVDATGFYRETMTDANTGEVIEITEGTWEIAGSKLKCIFFDEKFSITVPAGSSTWTLSFGKLKNGYWTLSKAG